jgi:ABC-2 type transport system ATP-binding protein
MSLAISTTALTKAYQPGIGVFDLDLSVPRQSVLAFLGPNGAGTTTTIRMLLGLISPDAGSVCIEGIELAAQRTRALARVGSMIESPALYPHLTAVENLRITQLMLDLKPAAIDRALAIVGLSADRHRQVRTYSLGMRQRLAIAQAMLPEPTLLILDEPSNGLDPAGMAAIRDMIRTMVEQEGLTVFLSSHLLEDVEKVATHVGMLAGGRLRMSGLMSELRKQRLVVHCSGAEQATALLAPHAERVEPLPDGGLALTAPSLAAHRINRLLVEAGHEVSSLGAQANRLEDTFLAMTADGVQA